MVEVPYACTYILVHVLKRRHTQRCLLTMVLALLRISAAVIQLHRTAPCVLGQAQWYPRASLILQRSSHGGVV